MMNPNRRTFIAASLAALAVPAAAAAAPVAVEVWKAPSCGCCKDWILHMESNGFKVKVHDSGNTAARSRLGMPIGSPGMDGPEYGARKDAYDVLLVRKDGSTAAYQSYR